jgi:hypothetical protein
MQSLIRFIRYWKQLAVHRFNRRRGSDMSGKHAEFKIARITSLYEYRNYARSMASEYENRYLKEQALSVTQESFSVPAFCFVCGQSVSFLADYNYGFKNANGQLIPNWRECLICPGCRLNNRMRASIHLFHELCRPQQDCTLYITEQATPMYKWFKGTFGNVVGSEYLSSDCSIGTKNINGYRHEDLTRLSFADGQFDFVLSFDVFEHIPDYRKAFRECRRVIKKDGVLFFTIPFDLNSARNIIRAETLPDGTTNHFLPPEYHGDPMQESGCLCYRYFGWECLDELKKEGFSEAACFFYWSREYGYLGGDQFLFMCKV